jgi:hypothetical protein
VRLNAQAFEDRSRHERIHRAGIDQEVDRLALIWCGRVRHFQCKDGQPPAPQDRGGVEARQSRRPCAGLLTAAFFCPRVHFVPADCTVCRQFSRPSHPKGRNGATARWRAVSHDQESGLASSPVWPGCLRGGTRQGMGTTSRPATRHRGVGGADGSIGSHRREPLPERG